MDVASGGAVVAGVNADSLAEEFLDEWGEGRGVAG